MTTRNYVDTHAMTTREALDAFYVALDARESVDDLMALRAQVDVTERGAKMVRDGRTMTVCMELRKAINAKLRKARRK